MSIECPATVSRPVICPAFSPHALSSVNVCPDVQCSDQRLRVPQVQKYKCYHSALICFTLSLIIGNDFLYNDLWLVVGKAGGEERDLRSFRSDPAYMARNMSRGAVT